MKESDILKMQKHLNLEPFVKETEYISKERALQEQREAMGTNPEEFLGYNPFKASIEIKLHSNYTNADSIAKIERLIKRNTNIQEILYQKELIDTVNENIRNISMADIYFSLGTNLGDKEQNLCQAINHIQKQIGKVISQSAFYSTPPW